MPPCYFNTSYRRALDRSGCNCSLGPCDSEGGQSHATKRSVTIVETGAWARPLLGLRDRLGHVAVYWCFPMGVAVLGRAVSFAKPQQITFSRGSDSCQRNNDSHPA